MNSTITDEKVERYIYDLLPESPSILPHLEALARRRGLPIVGPLVGRFLYIMARASGARRVLEVGTAIGYSAIWFGLAVKKNHHNGTVITVEIDKERAAEARKNIAKAGLRGVVRVVRGSGTDVIPSLRGKFDIVFIDEGKQNYPEYLRLSISKLKKGNGLLLADNALWHGEVLREKRTDDANGIMIFNELLKKEMCSVIIPARDGIAIGMTKK